jgi:hypothetical protein
MHPFKQKNEHTDQVKRACPGQKPDLKPKTGFDLNI